MIVRGNTMTISTARIRSPSMDTLFGILSAQNCTQAKKYCINKRGTALPSIRTSGSSTRVPGRGATSLASIPSHFRNRSFSLPLLNRPGRSYRSAHRSLSRLFPTRVGSIRRIQLQHRSATLVRENKRRRFDGGKKRRRTENAKANHCARGPAQGNAYSADGAGRRSNASDRSR